MDTRRIKTRRFPKEFRQVTKYIKEQKGISVVLGDDTDYKGPFTREIVIHHNYDLRHNGLYILLFECGKALLPFKHENKYDKEKQPQEYNFYQYDIDSLAWDDGYEIADELELNIDWDDYNKFRHNHLLKYFSDKLT